MIQRVVGHAEVLSAIQILRGLFEIQSATLEQAHAPAGGGKRTGQRYAGRSSADNADIAVCIGCRRIVAKIVKHTNSTCRDLWLSLAPCPIKEK